MSVMSPRNLATSRLRPQYQVLCSVLCFMVLLQVLGVAGLFGFYGFTGLCFGFGFMLTKRFNSQRAQRSLLVSLRASRTLAPAVTKTPSLPPARIGKALPIVLFSFLICLQSAFIVSLCICRLSACLTFSHIPSRTKLITAGAFPRSAYQ